MANLPPFLSIPWVFDGAPFNPSDPLVLTPEAQAFLQSLQTQLAATSQQPITPLVLTGQSASIGVTDLITLATGIYRVSYTARVTQASGATSTLQVQVISTQGGVTCTQTSAALVTNTTGSILSGAFLVTADPQTPLSFATIYGTTGVPVMKHDIRLLVEQLA